MSDDKKKTDKKIADIIKNNMFSATAILERQRDVISLSPSLDDILGGGIQSGSLVILVGEPKVGKTTTCLHFAKKAQQKGYNIVYLNIEGRLSERDLTSSYGLNIDGIKVIESTPEHPMSGEDFVGAAEFILKGSTKTVVIFDSFSQLIDESNQMSDIGGFSRDSMPLILSKFCKRVVPHLSITNNICLGITHQVANTSGYGSYKSETSGKKIQYAMNFKLRATKSELWYDTKDTKKTKPIGQIVEWICDNSAIGVKGKTTTSYIRYNVGIDEEYEIVSTATSLGILKLSGSWYTLDDGKKVQGLDNMVQYVKENPELFEQIKEEVRFRLDS